MEDRWQSYVDHLIEEARARGEFDPPARAGKRLGEQSTEALAGERAMAHKVMANSGHAPPFLMKKREIEARLERERAHLLRYARRRQRLHAEATVASAEGLAAALHARAERDWAWAVGQMEQALPELNKEIDLFNLMNEIPSLFKSKLRLEWELARVARAMEEEGVSPPSA